MNDLLRLILAPLIPSERIDFSDVDGLRVSTVFVDDLGLYETAILDMKGAHPVERYDNLEKAKEGHRKWVAAVPGLEKITKLGYLDLVSEKEIRLERMD